MSDETTNGEKYQRSVNAAGGVKEDIGKIRPGLIPPQVLQELSKVLTYGARKYAPDNWKKVETEKYIDALFRHLLLWMQSRDENKPELAFDEETGYHHLSHALTNLVFITYLETTKKK